MRVSIDKEDKAYDATMASKVDTITLDGKVLEYVISADDELNWVRYIGKNADGSHQIDPKDPSRFMVYEATGEVVIKLKERKWDNTRESKSAKVKVGRMPNGDIICQVFSIAKLGAARQFEVNAFMQRNKSKNELAQLVGIIAGSQMENMAERFGDRLDPSLVASVAVEQCLNMLNDEEIKS